MANEQYEIYQQGTAAALAEVQLALLNSKASPDASYPSLSAGSATGVTGDVETSSWMARQTNADGAALIESVKGNTLVWNQLVGADTSTVTIPSGHKYHSVIGGTSAIATSDGTAISVTGGTDQLFDLTAMFGAGNEPATVAEFEALFPEPYYPYDPGSLLPVRMTGIETTGFNQWDEQWELGGYDNTTGAKASRTDRIRSKNPTAVFPGTSYFFRCATSFDLYYYDGDGGFISHEYVSPSTSIPGAAFTTPSNAALVNFHAQPAYGTTYNHDICINISDPARNGTYEPYWRSERAIPASTYFPDGMRSAGSFYDELTNREAIHRVGVVQVTGGANYVETSYDGTSTNVNLALGLASVSGLNFNSDQFAKPSGDGSWKTLKVGEARANATGFWIGLPTDITTNAQADAWLAEHRPIFWYPLANPTITPIDPPLPMSYRVGAGGTERVMVAEGTMSAPPIFATRYPLDPADLAASIAPVDGPTAKSNHAVGELVMLGFTLCKVTTAIATGETIAIGTNVTRTTVAAEIAALS